MIEFFRKLFVPETSGATARERLRLVLLSDHLSLAPDVVASLRADLIAVISKYVEVDEANCDVSFEQQDAAVAVLANIPILALRSRPGAGSIPAPPPAVGGGTRTATLSMDVVPEPAAPAAPATRRRRRRRRAGNSAPAVVG